MTEKKFELNKDSNIMEVLENYPESAEIFAKNGLPCAGCAASRFEKLSDVASEFGTDLDKLIKELKDSAVSN
jgi:hybrid cluster-associated redox disulfide protein